MSQKVFLHVDLDAFYASVEQLDRPELRGKPVIVGGGEDERRAVVSTASYEARAFGVRSAMPIFQARRLCPQGIFLPVRMERYAKKSGEVMSVLGNYSPDVRQISIDEAFVDITGTERLFGKPGETARKLKAEVLESTGLTVSVGIAGTMYAAKIASGLSKPDGLFEVPRGGEEDFILSLPIRKLWGIGGRTLERLAARGLDTTEKIRRMPLPLLQETFGMALGEFLFGAVRGREMRNFTGGAKSRSISAETTFSADISDMRTLETKILELCHAVMFRARSERLSSRTAGIKIRYDDFSTVSAQSTGGEVKSLDDLFDRARTLFRKKLDRTRAIRLLGVSMQNVGDEGADAGLFDEFEDDRQKRIEEAIVAAERKNPGAKIFKARLLEGAKRL